MENPCIYHEKLEQRLSYVESDVTGLKTQTALDSQKSDLLFKNTMTVISDLSAAIKSLESTNKDIQDTLRGLQDEIKDSNRKADEAKVQLEKLDAKVCQIDSEGQLNLRETFRKYFIPVLLFVSGFAALIKGLM